MTLEYARRFARHIDALGIEAEHLIFEQSCHTVEQAAQAVNGSADDLVKNLGMTDEYGELLVGIVKGPHRLSTRRVAKACGLNAVVLADPTVILERTGYPVGGTPSFGFEARFLIDPAVMEQASVYTGGGSDRALVRISTKELQRANNAQIVRIRK